MRSKSKSCVSSSSHPINDVGYHFWWGNIWFDPGSDIFAINRFPSRDLVKIAFMYLSKNRLEIYSWVDLNVNDIYQLRRREAIWRQKFGSTLGQVMSCCLPVSHFKCTPLKINSPVNLQQSGSASHCIMTPQSFCNNWFALQNDSPFWNDSQ